MPMNRWVLLLLAGMAAIGLPWGVQANVAPASSPFIVDAWEEGLPQSSVFSIIQTRDGYLWMGTLNGLVRFDGHRFTVFDPATTPGLKSGRIIKLFEDRRGQLWLGTDTAGIAKVLPGGAVQNLTLQPGGREPQLRSICEDAEGVVWLYTAEGQLIRFEEDQFDLVPVGAGGPSLYRGVMVETNGRLWVAVDFGLLDLGPTSEIKPPQLPPRRPVVSPRLDFVLPSRNGGFWQLAGGRIQKWANNEMQRDLGPYPWTQPRVVTDACEDADGNLIVGVLNAGVYWFDAEGQATRISTAEGLTHDGVISVCLDREGNLWVGTDGGGLNRVRTKRLTVPPQAHGVKGSVVQSLSENDRGGLWIGYYGDGVRYWHGQFVRDFGAADGLQDVVMGGGQLEPEVYVGGVLVDREQNVWVGTQGLVGAGLFRLNEDRFERVSGPAALQSGVVALHQDRAGKVWFGTRNGLVRWDGLHWDVFTSRQGLSSPSVTALADDAAGNLWIGTQGGGLNRWREGQFEVIRRSDDGLPSDDIAALLVDDEGVLWVGTPSLGLARFHEGQWARFTTRHGLANNNVNYLLADGDYLWLGSMAGLMRVAKRELEAVARGTATRFECRVYGRADGLPTRECTAGSQPAACRTRDGLLLFPMIRGFAAVNPAALEPNLIPPPVVIESVLIEGQPQITNALLALPLLQVTLPPGKERLEISYTSLNLGAPERARFKYQLLGHEKEWIDAGNTRVARYSKLPHGEYQFVVTAANEDGIWNETGATLNVVVLPPFWRTTPFLVTAALVLLGGIIGTVHLVSTVKLRRELRQQQALEKDRSRIARDLHDQLGASMTQLSLLAEMVEADKEAPEEVEAHAQQITQAARQTTHVLDEIVWAVNPANDTLEGLVNYICKNAQDYLNVAGVKYRFEVPAQLPALPLAPEVRHNVFLAAKEAVTNVVRHARGTSAWIRLHLHATTFTLEIADDGCGVSEAAAQSTRNGLRNMRKRMEDVGGAFTVTRAPEGGALIRLTAPLAPHRK